MLFSGVGEAPTKALSNTQGWTAGLQFVEGRKGENGFRIGLDLGQRSYTLNAMSEDLREEFASVSTMLWISFEMRWSLSRRRRIFFELGPVIGVELREERNGTRFSEGYSLTGWYSDEMPASETETGFSIRDGHWRFGVTAELPLEGRWYVTGGAHLCPGVGSWARGHGYATMDASMRMGFLYWLSNKRNY